MRKFVNAKQLLQLNVPCDICFTYKSDCLFDVLAQNLCYTHKNKIIK